MKKKRGFLYWFINYIIFGVGSSIILVFFTKYHMPEIQMSSKDLTKAIIITSIFTFPLFRYGAKLLYDIFKDFKTDSWRMRIFTILAILGLFYRSCWDYNRTEKHKKEMEKNPQIEKQIKDM
ncbi:MAG: hypothetical protein PWP46_2018 [Fusobacteriaceae bacterium]|jgi:hypothetical protein|nr:hypothetical protein [Fusobacteriaceae bacterium]